MPPAPLAPRQVFLTALSSVVVCLFVDGHGAAQSADTQGLSAMVLRLQGANDPASTRVELGLKCLRALENSPDPEIERTVRLAIGIAETERERFREALTHLQVATQLARTAGDNTTLTHSLWLQAVAAFNLGDLNDSVAWAEEGIIVAESSGWNEARWRVANILGLSLERLGRSTEALNAFEQGLEVAEQTRDLEGRIVLRDNIGIAYMNLGELEQALDFFEQCQDIQLQNDTQLTLASTLANIGDVLILMDRLEEAQDYHDEALELRQQGDSEIELSRSYYSLGSIHQAFEEYEEALELFEKSLEIRRRLGLLPEAAATLTAMAQSLAMLDRDDAALDSALEGVRLAGKLEMHGRRRSLLRALVVVYEQQGMLAEALATEREASDLDQQFRSLETRQRLAEFRARDEALNKERQIELLSRDREIQGLELEQQRFVRNALVLGVLFVTGAAVAGWFAWASLRRATRRIRRLQRDRVRAEKLESIGVLAGGIAHDFNNILAAAVGNVSVLRMSANADSSTEELLDDVDQALDQATRLSSQLLALAKGGVSRRELQAMAPLIDESVSLALAGSRSKADLIVDPELWCAEVDSGQLRQLLSNVVLNADQSMRTGGPVEVLAENVVLDTINDQRLSPGPYVRVKISDRGTGIDPSIKDNLFDPYFTTKEGGSGLGLALCYAIAQRHHGSIDFHAREGGGTSFEIWIPAQPNQQQPQEQSSLPAKGGSGRILVMDDELLVRRVFGKALEHLGYDCELVEDGQAAIDAFDAAKSESRPFAAVILDLTVPGGMGARETLAELRLRDPNVRAVVASGYADDPLLDDPAQAGFAGFLPKPVTVPQLAEALAQTLSPNYSDQS